MPMQLATYDNRPFDRGASRLKEAMWIVAGVPVLGSWIPGSAWRASLLRLFGARIGIGPVIKPGVRVTFPWRLEVGDHVWIGERVWIDNLDFVRVGSNSCLSQGAYLCTGSHDWSADTFDLRTAPITLAERVWICAFARLAPGTQAGAGAVVSLGAIASGELTAETIYQGNPAKAVGRRHKTQMADHDLQRQAVRRDQQ